MLTRRSVWFLALVVLSGSGCASKEEPLWYKPGGQYTTAEFMRDQQSCTKSKKLDPDCMKAKGWVQVSPDRPEPTPPPNPERRAPY